MTTSSRQFFRYVRDGAEFFGETIGTAVNTVILFAVYIIGVGLSALLAMAFRKQVLDMDIDRERASYWHGIPVEEKTPEEYVRQF